MCYMQQHQSCLSFHDLKFPARRSRGSSRLKNHSKPFLSANRSLGLSSQIPIASDPQGKINLNYSIQNNVSGREETLFGKGYRAWVLVLQFQHCNRIVLGSTDPQGPWVQMLRLDSNKTIRGMGPQNLPFKKLIRRKQERPKLCLLSQKRHPQYPTARWIRAVIAHDAKQGWPRPQYLEFSKWVLKKLCNTHFKAQSLQSGVAKALQHLLFFCTCKRVLSNF